MAASLEATQRYTSRMKSVTAEGHFRECQGLMMSSIGLGTYLGEADSITDQNYRSAIVRAVEKGLNVLDTAINYRYQRSERTIGQAIRDLTSSGKATRDEIIIATKAGYLNFDGTPHPNPREYFIQTFLDTGIIGPHDVVAGNHCMTPRYLQHQIDQSLRNIGTHTIDIFYVHNPETQLAEIDRTEFYKRLRVAFGFLEGVVASGKIQMYGTATWNAYRVAPTAEDYLSIEDAVQCANDVAGEGHHFRFVQLPYNLAMTQAYAQANQKLNGRTVTILQACRELGLTVMSSASLSQAKLSRLLPPVISKTFKGLKTDAQRAIQFVRSTPGIAVALTGMSQLRHVEENLHLATIPPAPEAVTGLFNAP
jgi:aryl-alcohol dehydrogenase-like predicted oxidoreductase